MPAFPQEVVAVEPTLRFAPLAWARKNGGPIARAFIDALPAEKAEASNAVIRVKMVYLRPGWAPGNMVWHVDGLEAGASEDWTRRKPDYWRIACNFGGIAPTRLLVGTVDFPSYPPGVATGVLWHDHVDKALAEGQLEERHAVEGEMIQLGSNTIHSSSMAQAPGWRIFIDCNSMDGTGNTPFAGFYDEVHHSFQPRTLAEADLMAPYRKAVRV